jgi:hypothetical protein
MPAWTCGDLVRQTNSHPSINRGRAFRELGARQIRSAGRAGCQLWRLVPPAQLQNFNASLLLPPWPSHSWGLSCWRGAIGAA